MSFGPYLAAVAFGFIKGLTADRAAPFSTEMDFIGPVKEEVIYRGVPLWLKPNLPFGSTAAVFAADHIVSDIRKHNLAGTQMRPMEIVARLGDVLLGGCLYEAAARGPGGILGAIAAHSAHNYFCGLGSRVRR